MKNFSAKKAIIIAVIIVVVVAAAICTWYFGFYTAGTIGGGAAKAAALNDAGLTAAQVSGLESDFENEDGFKYYEVSFIYNAMEYEYAIDAASGQVLHMKSESVFD